MIGAHPVPRRRGAGYGPRTPKQSGTRVGSLIRRCWDRTEDYPAGVSLVVLRVKAIRPDGSLECVLPFSPYTRSSLDAQIVRSWVLVSSS